MVRWPGTVKAGVVSDETWAFWDFLPTAAELAGAGIPDGIDGVSLAPTLLGQTRKAPEFLYWEFHERGSKQAVRMGPWKGVRLSPDGPLELYDLRTDIGEAANVAGDHPGTVEWIETYLDTARSENAKWPLRTQKKKKQA